MTPAFDLLMQATTQLEALAAPLVERLEGAEAERGRERLAAVTELVVRANAAQAGSLLAEARARVLAEQAQPSVCADEVFAGLLAECDKNTEMRPMPLEYPPDEWVEPDHDGIAARKAWLYSQLCAAEQQRAELKKSPQPWPLRRAWLIRMKFIRRQYMRAKRDLALWKRMQQPTRAARELAARVAKAQEQAA